MTNFPDISVAPPNYALWLWVILPVLCAISFFFLENLIENVTEKHRGTPVVGVGYILMGTCLLVAAMAVPIVPDTIYAQRNASGIAALEDIGFEDIRLNIDAKTFGAYYDGELMRGVLAERPGHPGTYEIIQTSAPR